MFTSVQIGNKSVYLKIAHTNVIPKDNIISLMDSYMII